MTAHTDSKVTATQIRVYLTDDQYWTAETVGAFLREAGLTARSLDDWYSAIFAFENN